MEWSKLKNIILILLLCVNAFLLVLAGIQESRSARYEEETRQAAVDVLEQNGIAFALERLRGRLEQPRRLSGCGVEPAALRSALDAVAADALADFCTASNPRSAGPEDVKALLRELA